MAADSSEVEDSSQDDAPTGFELRGHPVMLAAAVARIFDVETREIVQNIKNNNRQDPRMFPERYAFEITEQEHEFLRSTGMISKPGRGGSRALPWVVTRKGSIRLAMIMRSPRAIHAADILVDIFDEVLIQMRMGRSEVAIPAGLIPHQADAAGFDKVWKKFHRALDKLLDTELEMDDGTTTVRDELQETTGGAVDYVKEFFRGRRVSNHKLEAETLLILEQARDLYERRQAELADRRLDRQRKALENFRLRLTVFREASEMLAQLKHNAVIGVVGGPAGSPSIALAGPDDMKANNDA